MQGPFVRKLIILKMSRDVSEGITAGGVEQVVQSFKSTGLFAKKATEWVEESLARVKDAPDNPYKSDEEIAEAILLHLEAVKTAQSGARYGRNGKPSPPG